ncbi:hypothetical protein QFZ22_000523 [Streptomyces canus]|uniref:Uncharacterized protein n=1 Tax=Streptomyces canus TaxID=58343 RepID=A0AAW8F6Z2_9ACTN|nr:hypothetical protein [Streptomyces canus]MDQ0904538.1 hypothetical protein [Streptomyces canus]
MLFVFAPAPRRAAPATREAAFHERARHVHGVNYRIVVATTTLAQLTQHGPDEPVWRVAGRGAGGGALPAGGVGEGAVSAAGLARPR